MKKNELIDELHKMLDAPFKDFMSAARRYDEVPSIPNGARKQSALLGLYKALSDMAEYASEKWNLTPDEFNAIVDELSVSDFTSAYN